MARSGRSHFSFAHPFIAAVLALATGAAAENLADLEVAGMTVPNRGRPGRAISVRIEVENKGRVQARGSASGSQGYLVDVVLSADEVVPVRLAPLANPYSEDSRLVGGRFSSTTNLAPGRSVNLSSIDVELHSSVTPGEYFLCVVVDPGNVVRESDETNNTLCVPFEVVASELAGGQVPAAAIDRKVMSLDPSAVQSASASGEATPAHSPTDVAGESRAQDLSGPEPLAVGGSREEGVSSGSAQGAGANRPIDVKRAGRDQVTANRKILLGSSRPAAPSGPGEGEGAARSPILEGASRARLCPVPVTLLGAVTDEEARRIYGTSVEVWRDNELVARMDTELGSFRFDGLCPGTYLLQVPANDGMWVRNHLGYLFRPATREVVLGGTDATLDLVISRAVVSIRGLIRPAGEPPPPFRVYAIEVGEWVFESGEDGYYELALPCCAEYEVRPRTVEGLHFEPRSRSVQTAPGEFAVGQDFEVYYREAFQDPRAEFPRRELGPVSLGGPQPELRASSHVNVPDMVGQPTSEARRKLHEAGWDVSAIHIEYEEVRDNARIPILGTVARQRPGAGTPVRYGSPITLVSYRVDPNWRLVPDLAGSPSEEVLERLGEYRIPVHVARVNPCPPEELRSSTIDRCRNQLGKVVRQSPEPGIYPESTVVEVEIGAWPDPKPVPDAVDAQQLLSASDLLRSNGFLARFRTDRIRMSSDCIGFEVTAQTPEAGTLEPYGTLVTLDVCWNCSSEIRAAGFTVREGSCDLQGAMQTLTELLGYPPLNGRLY